ARVDELADELESGSIPPPVPSPPPVEDAEASAAEVDDEPPPEAILATSMELPGGGGATGRVRAPIAAAEEPGVAVSGGPTLVLLSDGRELDRVVKDRFLIGRGKHCDLIINSGKVSREHAAITREGSTWFIEDLGSSNGTWFEKRRISRRQIQEGDEYYICAEKLSCSFR
ncbi:MAG TPA: FHA domain-containing protein, partial [Thermoanaerobaculia bacterium]